MKREFVLNLMTLPHGAPSQEVALHGCSPPEPAIWSSTSSTGARVAQNEVSRDVWRPVAHVVADNRCAS
jgi:hypothetical protein